MDQGKYLYCIIEEPGDRNFGRIGIGDREDEVYTIGSHDLAGVVSNTPMTQYVINRENLTRHERVIEEVMKDYTVLPVRFCTIASSVEEIRNLLNRRRQEFKNLLRSTVNKVELGLKVYWKKLDEVFVEITASNKQIRQLKEKKRRKGESPTLAESTEIGEEIKRRLEQKRNEVAEGILEQLRPLCTDVKTNGVAEDRMVLNSAFLVDRMREPEFDDQVEMLTEQHADRLKIKYVGPAPPFHFVELVIPWGQEE